MKTRTRAFYFLTIFTLLALMMSCKAKFESIKIGNQVWMAKNLDVSKFKNGDPIPEAKTSEEWDLAGRNRTPAWCYYKNDPNVGKVYGKLYNWYAVNDPRGLAPRGWHIPSDHEWKTLEKFLGMSEAEVDSTGIRNRGKDEGAKLKETGNSHWEEPYDKATNESGFTALPAASRGITGSYGDLGQYTVFWTSTEIHPNFSWQRFLLDSKSQIGREYHGLNNEGCSVRCIKD